MYCDQKKQLHAFKSDENARFIVADLDNLPTNLLTMPSPCFTIDDKLMSYLNFIDKQLHSKAADDESHLAFELFYYYLVNKLLATTSILVLIMCCYC